VLSIFFTTFSKGDCVMLEFEEQSWIRKNIYPVTLSLGVLVGGLAGQLLGASSFSMTIGVIGGGFAGLLIAMFMSNG